MSDFFSENRTLKILAIIAIISLPIFLSVWFGKFRLSMFTTTPVVAPKTSTESAKVYLYCPSIEAYCTKGITIQESGKSLGFGGKVPANSPILAAFNGYVTSGTITINSKSGKETINMITLSNPEANTTAIYYFNGESIDKTGIVKVGTKIATVTKNVNTYNTSLLFQLYYGDPTKVSPQILSPNSFLIPK